MSRVTRRIIDQLIREGTIPREHRRLASLRLERELRRRSLWVAQGLAREAIGVLTISAAT